MELKQAKALIRRLGEGAKLYGEHDDRQVTEPNYSGRGMYGARTFAVVCSRDQVPNTKKYRVDSLGLSMVIY